VTVKPQKDDDVTHVTLGEFIFILYISCLDNPVFHYFTSVYFL